MLNKVISGDLFTKTLKSFSVNPCGCLGDQGGGMHKWWPLTSGIYIPVQCVNKSASQTPRLSLSLLDGVTHSNLCQSPVRSFSHLYDKPAPETLISLLISATLECTCANSLIRKIRNHFFQHTDGRG